MRIPRSTSWRAGAKIALLLAFVLAALEALGALALKVHLGHLPSRADLRSEREAIAAKGPTIDPATGQERIRPLEVIHPYVGFVYDPAANSFGVGRIHGGIGVNDFGLLDLESPIRRPGRDETIVGITGGSVAFWFSARGTLALERELRASAAFRDRRLTFVRLALGGYKEPQQLMLLTYLLSLGAHFDVLINIDGFNEVALPAIEQQRAGVHPAFPRNWPVFVASMDRGERALLLAGILSRIERRSRWAVWMDRTPLGASFLGNAVWKMLDDAAAREIGAESNRLSTWEEGARPYYLTGPPSHYETDAEVVAAAVPIWRDSSIQIDRLCRGNGIRYFHFLQPNQYDPGSKPIGAEEAKIALVPDHPYKTGAAVGYPLLRNAGTELDRAGVAFTDLSQIFRDHPEPLYRDDCCHVNQRGNDLLAAAIGRTIVERWSEAR